MKSDRGFITPKKKQPFQQKNKNRNKNKKSNN